MKKSILLFTLLLIPWMLPAPGSAVCYIEMTEPIKPYNRLIRAVGMVESKLDTLAYNPKEKAVGYFQIRPIRLLDYNKRTGKNYTLDQMYDYKIAESVFLFYASKYDYRDIKGICVGWNGKSIKNKYYKNVKKVL